MKSRAAGLSSAGVALLLVLALGPKPCRAGWIEDAGDRTIIHVKVHDLPNRSDPGTTSRAEFAGVKLFKERFPDIFAERYRDKYKANPGKYGRHNWDHVEIEFHQATGIRMPGVESELLMIAGDLAPDVMNINFRKSDTYIRNNFLYPLDEYFDTIPKEELDFRIHPNIWPVIERKGSDGKKHKWVYPYGGALGRVLWYRKDLFDQHGIPYPTNDWTWDDMLAASRKITDPERGIYGCRMNRGGWFWLTWLWSAGGDVMAYNEEADEWRCIFGSREAAVALEFYTRMAAEKWTDAKGRIRRGYSTLEVSEDVYAKWDRGEIGMMMAYIDERVFATLNPELTGMVPVPLGPTGVRGGELNSKLMGLFGQIREPAVRDAAWEYIRFYDSAEPMAVKTKIMVEGGLGRFINPRYLNMFGYPEVERLAPKGWAETFKIALDTGHPEPYGRNSNLAYVMMGYPVDEALQLAAADKLPTDYEARVAVLHDLLVKAEARANEEMIGLITPRERLKRRVAAWVLLLAIIASFALISRRIFRAFTPPTSSGHERRRAWDFGRYAWAYILLLPAALTVLVWHYLPLMRGSVMAFFDYKLIGQSLFVGVDNFGDLLFDSFWWRAVWNALRYSFLVVALTFLPPIGLAIALQEVPRGKLFFRLIYYLPAVITGIVTILLWKQFYEPSERGALNAVVLHIPAIGFIGIGVVLFLICLAFMWRLLRHEMRLAAWGLFLAGLILLVTCCGLAAPILFPSAEDILVSVKRIPFRLFRVAPEPFNWLNDPGTAMLSCILPMIWAGIGPGCLIYLAALKGIPDDFYEAAEIDGSGFLDKILFVVFPTLKSLIIINFVGVFIQSWYAETGNILAMTGGAADTETAGLHIWYKAFTFLKFGPATAMAWVLGFMLIGFTVYQLQILSRVEFRAAGQKA